MGIHPGGFVREVPNRDPREPDRERGTDDSEEADEHEVQDDITDKTNQEDLHSLMDTSDPREYLEVDLEEEVEHDKEGGVLEDDSGHCEFVSEEYGRDKRTEDEHEHARNYPEHGKVFIEQSLDDSDFALVSLPVELRYDRKEKADNRSDDNERDSDNAQIVGIVSGIASPEEVDDELHVDLAEHGPDIGGEHHPESVFHDLPDQFFVVGDLGVFEIGEIVRTVHKERSENDPDHHAADPCPGIGNEISFIQ